MSEWSQPPDAQLDIYEPVAAPRGPKEQMPRRLPAVGGGGGGRPVYVDISTYGGEAMDYDVPGGETPSSKTYFDDRFDQETIIGALLREDANTAAVADSYCGTDCGCYSVAPDYMDSAPVDAWNAPALSSINPARCASDAGCYGFAMQHDG
ncbi:hypothetical protein ISF_09854 [Cordyceps fumosorosea ARSEF 2679]|uniref:Uncharacterized protein n=1 Tax=Cordyceps fumosorosea (strain ARSEF 2679) TaxID=1081104 RepID=A0A167AZ51_CORFA|nr:hypothetical protein ISF_09854 [Cordyceps fumosorosea ARSEF 2679]OAA39479.1 hypothetical protein ISF_09854 [Cordyceps fumosorosea ARSEF 2679]